MPTAPAATRGSRARAAAFALAAALLAVHAALAWLMRPLWLDVGDDAAYVLLARSVRSLSYRSIFLAGAPQHVQYPPGFPALLAATAAAFGERVVAFAAVQTLLSTAALALLFDAARRRWSLALALLLLATCAVNPLLAESAPALLSETPFMALCALSLWAVARDGPSPRWLLLAGTAALAAALTRTAGVALVAALLLAWCSERRWRAAGALLAGAAVALGGWFLWTSLAPGDALHYTYGADLARGYGGPGAVSVVPGSPVAATPPAAAPSVGVVAGDAARAIVQRVVDYLTRIVPYWLPVPTIAGTRLDNVGWLAFIVGFGAAGVWALWRRWRAASLFVACYAALLALWPWALERLLSPAMPLLLLAVLAGIHLAARRRPGPLLERVVPLGFVACVVGAAVARDATALRNRRACLEAEAALPLPCARPELRSVIAAADYLREHTGPGDTLLTSYGAGVYARAERVTLPLAALAAAPDSASRGGVGGPASGKYVLVTLNSRDERARAAQLRGRCADLEFVRVFPPAALVLRSEGGVARAVGADACAALDTFLRTASPP